MLFNSISFFIFLAGVFGFYVSAPQKLRPAVLLLASYIFYAVLSLPYAGLLLCSTLSGYGAALLLAAAKSPSRKKFIVVLCLCFNIALLFAFKYSFFFYEIIKSLVGFAGIAYEFPAVHILLPVGISFYTFKTISYIIDVYRKSVNPEKDFIVFALYVSFFPSLLAGPIDRASRLLPQLRENRRLSIHSMAMGAQLIFWGLFKKVVIADRLAIYADSVFNNVAHHTGPSFLVAAYFYTIQIYCDFSGYTDMARGVAALFGFNLMQNFNLPYFATTITDFWRRWHITLSTWFRDYLYIPLGGNRKGTLRTYCNLLLTMAVCGLWHGASWTFILWGVLHGLMLCASRATLSLRDKTYAFLRMPNRAVIVLRTAITFNIVCFLWIFFRANTISDALTIISRMGTGWPVLFVDAMTMLHGILGIVVLCIVECIQRVGGSIRESVCRSPLPVRWAIYLAAFFSIVLFGVDGGSQFIYFQF